MQQVALAILPLAIQFIGWLLDKSRADKEAKTAWISFVEKVCSQESGSVKAKNSYEEQLKRLKNESNSPKP